MQKEHETYTLQETQAAWWNWTIYSHNEKKNRQWLSPTKAAPTAASNRRETHKWCKSGLTPVKDYLLDYKVAFYFVFSHFTNAHQKFIVKRKYVAVPNICPTQILKY